MVKILHHHKADFVYTREFTKILRQANRLKIQNPSTIYFCNCPSQRCRGKYIRKYEWQIFCQWEMINLGFISDVSELSKGLRYWELNKDTKP